MMFIGRESELKQLGELEHLSKKKHFIVVLYGLRRVGKTRLLLEFVKNRGSYFFVNKNKTSADLLNEFQNILKDDKTLSELEDLRTWDDFFKVIMARKTTPVIFDEFQNFAYVEPAVFGIVQKNADLHEDRPGMMLLSGSLIGLMKKLFRDSGEPLYGRIKKGLKIDPLNLASCLEFGTELDISKEDAAKLYCVFGGYPKYYVAVEDFGLNGRSADEIIDSLLLSADAPLEDEVNIILSQEFGGRSGVYYSILEAIASGNNTLSSIAGYLNATPTSLTRQIKELKDYFELIELEMPYEGKRGIYRIKHPLIYFWFSQIYKNYSEYVSRRPKLMDKLRRNLDGAYGHMFERTASEFLAYKIGLTEARRQWGKIPGAKKGENTYEIDLIGRSGETTYLFEFKWAEVGFGEAKRIIQKLQQNSKHIPSLKGEIKYGIVAKKILQKNTLQAAGHAAYDIRDF
ncbi:MAG: ATP-binding protein [Candidatus Altiarchaeota archaeon]